jgi:hypothetical protein
MDAALTDSDPRNDAAAIDAYVEAADALKALTAAVVDNTSVQRDLEKQRADEAVRALAVSQSQYGILAQALWDATNQFGGARLGIGLSGLRAPAGSVARI